MICPLLLLFFISLVEGDHKPCALRDLGNDKKVCVCNSTYCDTMEQVPKIENEQFVAFISSKKGMRFEKQTRWFSKVKRAKHRITSFFVWILNVIGIRKSVTFAVDPEKKYQEMYGFGGAITDSVGINLLSLSEDARNLLLRSYYSPEGAEYNLCRVPIGGTDFSTRKYSYDDGPKDPQLERFALAKEDFTYRIPFYQQAMAMSHKEVKMVAAVWSPPVWMKTNGDFAGYTFLKDVYFATYAKYILRFLDEYQKVNIPIWALSTGNEPLNGNILKATWNSLGWTPSKLAQWTVNYMGPLLRESVHKHIKLVGYEDQRYGLPFYIDMMVEANPGVLNYLDAFALHWYGDSFTSAKELENLHNKYPDKPIIYTEACEGPFPWARGVDLGSWARGQNYILNIIQNMNVWMSSWIDWNIALNMEGGPTWAENFIDSPILVNAKNGEFYKQPMYYAMAHVSKFIEYGAQRIDIKPTESSGVHATAVENKNGRIVIIVCNTNDRRMTISISIAQRIGWINLKLPGNSFTTILTDHK